MKKKNYGTSADFKTYSIVNARKKAKNTIDTFNGSGFEGADFGCEGADFGYSTNSQGQGHANQMWNEFQRQGMNCVDKSDAPLSYSEVDYSDEQAYAETHDDMSETAEDIEEYSLSEDDFAKFKQIARQKIIAALREQNASDEVVTMALDALDAIATPEVVEEAVISQIENKKIALAHPLLNIKTSMSGLGAFSFNSFIAPVLNTLESQAQTTVVTALKPVVTQALTSATQAVAPVIQPAATSAATAALQYGKATVTDAIKDIWTKYKVPVAIGGASIFAGIMYKLLRKK